MKTGSGNERNNIMKNNHPTVKPIKLMTYLVTLGSRPTDLVLDPFAGSGTTGIACIQTGRDYILIEKDKDYYNIMLERLHGVSKQQTL
jgi:site-specific DNA-methyltransferase (adenine-specific)